MTLTVVPPSSFSDDFSINDVLLDWTTASKVGLLGFNIYRSDDLAGAKQKLNVNFIPAPTPRGLRDNAYQFTNKTAISGHTDTYWLELVIFHGNQASDPVTVLVPYWIWRPLMPR